MTVGFSSGCTATVLHLNFVCCSDVHELDQIKATLLGLLLFLDAKDLLAEWARAGGPTGAAAVAAFSSQGQHGNSAGEYHRNSCFNLMRILAVSKVESWCFVYCLSCLYMSSGSCLVLLLMSTTIPPDVVCAGMNGTTGHAGSLTLADPHPALQLLLRVEVAATLTVLAEATDGWDAVETDLRAAAGKPAEELESVLVATQVRRLVSGKQCTLFWHLLGSGHEAVISCFYMLMFTVLSHLNLACRQPFRIVSIVCCVGSSECCGEPVGSP